MDTKILVIQCTYSDNDESLADILDESFRIYLQKELRTFAINTGEGVS